MGLSVVCAEFEWTLSSFFLVRPSSIHPSFSRGRSLARLLLVLLHLFVARSPSSPRSHSCHPSADRPFCLARPRSTLRPVIKQPRGGQIESVEETRERRRRGDGQLAATMVSIVKGPSRGALAWVYRCEAGPNEGQNAGVRWDGEEGRVAWLTGARWTDTSWSPIHPPTESPERVRAMDRRPSRRPSTSVVV